MIKALIFDFDGLILDTETPEFQAWQDLYREYGQILNAETWGQIVGGTAASDFDPLIYLQELVGAPLDLEMVESRKKARDAELIAAQPIRPGIVDYLNSADQKGIKLAVASSSTHSWVDTHLTRLNLFRRFDKIICRDDVPRAKPFPDLFLAAAEAVGARPEEAIAFEDSPNGVLAARRAGMFVVCIPNPMTAQLSFNGDADITLNSLDELPLHELLGNF
ncbi:MAG: HAD family phosphatase [Anaerolineales bacterium]|nr:HAD family phosphatase [Anaerolineales bacterium]